MFDKVFIHESCFIDEPVKIGEGTRIWHRSHVMKNASIGRNCNIGENAFIESGVILGNGVKVKNNVALYTGVVCEDDVFLGPNCVFTNVINPRSFINRKEEFKDTIIRKGATIGANSTIICGVVIGEYAMVGAGSVVTKDVVDFSLVVGNPARFRSYICKCGVKLDKSLVCRECHSEYKETNKGNLKLTKDNL